MNFTTDGYTEPLKPRPLGLIIGAVLAIGGVVIIAMGSYCLGPPVLLLGALFALNETGTRRIRVTRSKLLMEEESRVRGLLIGPRRERLTWEETQAVTLESDHVKMVATDGTVLVLGQGGPALELEKLKNRIDLAMIPD